MQEDLIESDVEGAFGAFYRYGFPHQPTGHP